MGGSKTNDAGIGLLSKMGIDFLNNEVVIEAYLGKGINKN